MTVKIRLMLTREDGASDAALGAALRDEAARLDRAVLGSLQHRRAFQHPDGRLYEVAKGFLYTGAPGFDSMMEVIADDGEVDRVEVALKGFADRLAGLIRPERSAAVVGPTHDIIRGSGPVHYAIGARRLPSFTHDGYIAYWFGDHSNEARSTDDVVGGMGYRQIHCDPALSRRIAQSAGVAVDDFDGMSETYFADAAAVEAVYSAPGVWEHAFADEQRFVDHGRSVFSVLLMADD